MQNPIQITFRDIPHSLSVEAYIRDKIDKLEQFFNPIISCQITIEQSQKHNHQGKLYNIHIVVSVPDNVITTTLNQDENFYTAFQRAFDDCKKQLDEYTDKLKGHVKKHPLRIKGKIVRIFQDRAYGFINDNLGNEYYFGIGAVHHQNFYHLQVGDNVHFIAAMGNEGLQAHRVCPFERKKQSYSSSAIAN